MISYRLAVSSHKEAEMNLKQRCAVCKKEVVYFRMVLMMGPKGYRRYQCCDRCAGKVERGSVERGGVERGGGSVKREAKAGA